MPLIKYVNGDMTGFSDQSSGEITSYAWDFGDGGTSAETNPSYTYVNPGQYTVTLTVSGPGGSGSAQVTITVSEMPAPEASNSSNAESAADGV